jgi:hypothetical protein
VKPSKLACDIVDEVLTCVDYYGIGFVKDDNGNRRLEVSSVVSGTSVESGIRVMERHVQLLLTKRRGAAR